MWISHLSVQRFRNIRQTELQPHPRFTVLVGPNGAGKSNLLESIHVLGNVRSFRPVRNQDLIQQGEAGAEIIATVVKDPISVAIRTDIDARRKRFWVNGNPISSFADYLGQLTTVVFSPDDLQLLRGRSSDRRRFVDRVVCSTRPVHLADLQTYASVLQERNRLLKSDRVEEDLLDIYSDQIVPLAADILDRRLELVEAIEPSFQEVFSRIFSDTVKVRCQYHCPWISAEYWGVRSSDRLREAVGRAVKEYRRKELFAKHTLVGPHRDDIRLEIDGLPASSYASQGQMRAIILALKITEIQYLQQVIGQCPVLLLDDVSSELDRSRNEQLFSFIRTVEAQTFITTTDRSYIQLDRDVRCVSVQEGVFTEMVGQPV